MQSPNWKSETTELVWANLRIDRHTKTALKIETWSPKRCIDWATADHILSFPWRNVCCVEFWGCFLFGDPNDIVENSIHILNVWFGLLWGWDFWSRIRWCVFSPSVVTSRVLSIMDSMDSIYMGYPWAMGIPSLFDKLIPSLSPISPRSLHLDEYGARHRAADTERCIVFTQRRQWRRTRVGRFRVAGLVWKQGIGHPKISSEIIIHHHKSDGNFLFGAHFWRPPFQSHMIAIVCSLARKSCGSSESSPRPEAINPMPERLGWDLPGSTLKCTSKRASGMMEVWLKYAWYWLIPVYTLSILIYWWYMFGGSNPVFRIPGLWPRAGLLTCWVGSNPPFPAWLDDIVDIVMEKIPYDWMMLKGDSHDLSRPQVLWTWFNLIKSSESLQVWSGFKFQSGDIYSFSDESPGWSCKSWHHQRHPRRNRRAVKPWWTIHRK